MGHAAHMRGSAVISRQFDRDAEAARRLDPAEPLQWEDMRDRLTARADAAEKDLERARRSIRILRATLTEERTSRRVEVETLQSQARDGWRAMLMYRSRWEWVSRLLRRLVPAHVVAAARADEPDLFAEEGP